MCIRDRLAYKERTKFSKNEQVFLEKFVEGNKTYSFENGFEIINYEELRPILVPIEQFKSSTKKSLKSKILKKLKGKPTNKLPDNFLFPEFYDVKKITKKVNELIEIFEKNKDFEYEILREKNTKISEILGNSIKLTNVEAYQKSPLEKLDYLPLSKIWKDWYHGAKFNDYEMLAAVHNCRNFNNVITHIPSLQKFHRQYIPELLNLNLDKGK